MATLDFSEDQAIFDNLESVTYTSVRTAGNVSVAIGDAGYYPQGLSEGAPSYGVYTKGRSKFSIRMSLLESVGGAKPRDYVTRADGVAHTVLQADAGNITAVWQLSTVNLALAADLRGTCTLSRPVLARDAAGRPAKASYTTVAADVPCRVQPLADLPGQGGQTNDKVTLPQRYTAYLAYTVDARANDRFVSGGVTYSVYAAGNPERIDELFNLTLEIVLP